jgi:hypothetical protein
LQQEGPRLTRVVALPQEIRMSRRISPPSWLRGARLTRDHQADIAKVQEWLPTLAESSRLDDFDPDDQTFSRPAAT